VNVLFLSQVIPYPPDAGPKVKTWNVLRYLAGQGHTLTLLSFSRPGDEAHLPALRQVCAEVHAVPIRRSRPADGLYLLRSLVSGRPFLVERDDLPGMRSALGALVQPGRFDVLHADQLSMAQYALSGADMAGQPGQRRPALILDAHNAVWTVLERVRRTAPFPLNAALALEAGRTRRYEGALVRRFDRTLAVTEIDRAALLQAAEKRGEGPSFEDRIAVIPIAVDTVALGPVARRPHSTNLLTLGTLHYPPNADGIRWFANQVFPLVRRARPEVTLTIVGKAPPPDFHRLAAQSGGAVSVTGYVPDLAPYLERCAGLVIPVRAGGGMRVRILEAFSRGIPVVTTTVGLEGIQAAPGRDVLVADSEEGFAGEVLRLLANPGLRDQLAHNGRALARRVYDWQAALKGLDAVYGAFANDPGTCPLP
jgi:glycosyltransferase involved in cell wall biosynthesis